LTEGCGREATGLWPHHRVEMKCLGIRTAVPCGRGDRAPPRKSPSASSLDIPRKAICPWPSPRGGAGSARPEGRYWLDRRVCPGGHGPLASSSGGNEMPWHAYGHTTRTHGVRPSEKTAFAPSRGLSPLAKPRWGQPPSGGAGSARPQMRLRLERGIAPLGPRAFDCPQ
jgi:hypothetical protein